MIINYFYLYFMNRLDKLFFKFKSIISDYSIKYYLNKSYHMSNNSNKQSKMDMKKSYSLPPEVSFDSL